MNEYVRLIEEFCISQDIQDIASVLHEGLIDFDDIPMRLEYLEASGQCRALADLGEIPEEHEDQLLAFMLEENFNSTDRGLPVLSLNPATRRAAVSIHLDPAATLAGGGLAAAVATCVMPCVAWWNEVMDHIENHADLPTDRPDAFGAFV